VSYVEDREVALAWRAVMRSSDALVAAALALDAEWEKHIRERFLAEGWPAFRAAVAAGALMGVVRAVLISWYEGDGRADLVALGRDGLDLLEAGFGDPALSRRTGS